MISHIHQTRLSLPPTTEVHLLYSTRIPIASDSDVANLISNILFLDRLRAIILSQKEAGEFPPLKVHLHLTNISTFKKELEDDEAAKAVLEDMTVCSRRISAEDLRRIVSGERNESRGGDDGTVCYVCGPPTMTDELVGVLQGADRKSVV